MKEQKQMLNHLPSSNKKHFFLLVILVLTVVLCGFQTPSQSGRLVSGLLPSLGVSWIEALSFADAITITAMTTVPYRNDIVIVGMLDTGLAANSSLMLKISNSQTLPSTPSLIGYVSLMDTKGFISWTYVVGSTPSTVSVSGDFIYMTSSPNGVNSYLHKITLTGNLITAPYVSDRQYYDSATDPVTQIMYLAGTKMSGGNTAILVEYYLHGSKVEEVLSSDQIGTNIAKYISVYNGSAIIGGTTSAGVNFISQAISGPTSFAIVFDTSTKLSPSPAHYANNLGAKAPLVAITYDDRGFAAFADGTLLHSSIISPVSFIAAQGGSTVEIHGFESHDPTSNVFVITGQITGSAILFSGLLTISSRQSDVANGFVCVFTYPSSISADCSVFGGLSGADYGKAVTVDSSGHIIVASPTNSVNKKWSHSNLPDAHENLIAKLGEYFLDPTVILSLDIIVDTQLYAGITYLITKPITATADITVSPGAVIVFSGNSSLSLVGSQIAMLGTTASNIQIQSLVDNAQTLIISDSQSTVVMDHIVVSGQGVSLLGASGGSITITNSRVDDAASRCIQMDAPENVQLIGNTITSNSSSVDPIISITRSTGPTVLSITGNAFVANNNHISLLDISIRTGTNSSITIDNNSLTGGEKGITISAQYQNLNLSYNDFIGIGTPLNMTLMNNVGSIASTTTIESNEFIKCHAPTTITKMSDGKFLFRNNSFRNNSGDCILSFTNSYFCAAPIVFDRNTFADNELSNQVVSLHVPDSCSLVDFSNNLITTNTLLSTFQNLVSIKGTVKVNYNRFQSSTKRSIVNLGQQILNVQYNYWESLDPYQVRRASGNPSSTLRNVSTLYTPYINENGVVYEHDLFSSAEKANLVDCLSVRNIWPEAPSGVYRINPYCESMLVRCRMTPATTSIVMQRRQYGDVSFNVDYSSYENGFGNLMNGDFFLGLKKIYLLTKAANIHNVIYSTPALNGGNTPGLISIGSAETYYALTAFLGAISYTNIPFGTVDRHSDVQTSACASQQLSGWWFGNCTSPSSWNLNAPLSESYSGIYFQSVTDIRINEWILLSADQYRNYMICLPGVTCFSKNQSNPSVCSGNGFCTGMDTCACKNGWIGLECDTNITINASIVGPNQYCDNAIITTLVTGADDKLTFKWSVDYNNDMLEGVDAYLATQTGATLILPGKFIGEGVNLLKVEVFYQSKKAGELLQAVSMPYPVLNSSHIYIEDSNIVARKYETYSLTLRLRNLPSCIDYAVKKWQFDGKFYSTLQNSLMVDFVPTESKTINVSLSLLSQLITISINTTVLPALPVARISGGNRMLYSFHDNIIDASQSYDRDVSANATARYIWSCVGCHNFVISNSSKVILNEDVGVYLVRVTFISNVLYPARNASTQVTLTLVDDASDMPLPQISTPLPDVLDIRKKLRIESTVTKNRPNDLLEYEWTVLRKEANEKTVIYGSAYNVVPLALAENFLQPNSAYAFSLRVKYRNFTNFGEVSVTGKTASAPIIQAKTCSPCNGTALTTQFQFMMRATDLVEYYPLQYSFSYYDMTNNRYIPLQTSYIPNVQTLLPYMNSGFISVQGVVTNFFGVESKTQFNISISESKNTSETLNELISGLNDESSYNILTVVTGSLKAVVRKNDSNPIVDTVLSFMSNKLDRETRNASLIESTMAINALAIETITELSVDTSTLNVTNSCQLLVNKIIDMCSEGNLELRDSTTNSLARSVSNLMLRYQSYESESVNQMVPSISKISSMIAHFKLISENQTNIITDTYQLSVKKENGDTIGGASVYTGDVQVLIPRNISLLSPEQDYVVQSISFNQTYNPYLMTSQNFSTPVVDFEIRQGDSKVKLSDMEYPLAIVLNKEVEKENSSFRFECRYMDETTNSSWYTDGCWLHDEGESSVTCYCTHTTSFSAMIIYDPKAPNKASDGLYITSIIINSFFALISIFLLVMVFVWRRKQPIKSRFLAPYIGLGAIIVECVLNGIIRNSLLIAANNARDYKGINSIAYLILTIVNPIVLLSLFIYFWQMLRYFFLKNLYAIMNIEKRNLKKIRFLKMLSSKLVYIGLGSLVLAASCSYFVIVSILEATNVIKPNAASAFNALSFSIMSLFLGALIVATFIWDCTIILSRKLLKREMKKTDEGNADLEYLNRIFSTLVNHFRSDDPLMFRIESMFMVSAMIVMTISYIVGISDRYNSKASPNSAAKIIEFLFDILYLSLRIMAFGGLSTLVRFIQRFKLHREHEDYETLKQYMSDLKSGTSSVESQLQNMLRDEYGYLAISTYAKKEFALENIILWKRLEEVRADNITASVESRRQYLQELHDDCLARGSPFECNLPNKVKKHYRVVMEQTDVSAAEAEELFLNVSNELLVNICDTFTRFSVSPEYAHYKKVTSMAKELRTVGHLQVTTESKAQ